MPLDKKHTKNYINDYFPIFTVYFLITIRLKRKPNNPVIIILESLIFFGTYQ